MSDLWNMVNAMAFTHIWIALGAAGAAAATLLMQGYGVEAWTPIMRSGVLGIGVATGCIYTLQRWVKLRKHPQSMPPERRAFLKRSERSLAIVWGLTAVGWAMGSMSLWRTYSELVATHFWTLGALGALALGYASNPFTGGTGWRNVPHMKWPVIALAWGLVTGWLPLQLLPGGVQVGFWVPSVLAQTAFVAGITLPFDVRDLGIDSQQLRTVPQQAGDRATLLVACALVALSGGAFWAMDATGARAAACVAALIGIGIAFRNRREWVFSMWLDGCLILQGVLAFMLR